MSGLELIIMKSISVRLCCSRAVQEGLVAYPPQNRTRKNSCLVGWLVGYSLWPPSPAVLPSCSAYAQRAVEGATKFPSNLGVGDG